MQTQAQPPPRQYFMADVRDKRPTRRRAVAVGEIQVGDAALAHIVERRLPKGDALALAEIAGIQGAKNASALMPLCHPLNLDLVRIRCVPVAERASMRVYAEVACEARTGVEMEALAAVNAALLTIYDLTKPVQPALCIGGVRLLFKEGGKKGLWTHPQGISAEEQTEYRPKSLPRLDAWRTAVLTLSDRASSGVYEDKSGPVLADALRRLGADVQGPELLADEQTLLVARLKGLAAEGCELVVSTGGTGLGARDITPEALAEVATRQVPGLAEMFRSESRHHTSLAWLSRANVVMLDRMLIIALPGSPRAAAQGIEILQPLLAHARAMMRGERHP